MASNSIAPSARTVDLYLDGADWKLALHEADGVAQIGAGTVGGVDIATGGVVTLPLDLRALGGEPAHELRFFGGGVVKLIPTQPLSTAFPVSAHTVGAGEVLGIQVEKIVDMGANTRVRIAFGGS